ncbi:hypothetical protein [Poseidonibacter ostreae]|uniref:Uncharacterized protein n=1 Tax=Poseidonibacter ostreae TaxID=2654171 RepID=A0ABQ6VH82_9BACT|nr:hypothetical protein [Poseidonibacter ostreae]KAB7886088.1 hypothetical protein GBG18_14810 [Poseidonibacter ostreae]
MKTVFQFIFAWIVIVICYYIISGLELKTIATICLMLLLLIAYGIFFISNQISKSSSITDSHIENKFKFFISKLEKDDTK